MHKIAAACARLAEMIASGGVKSSEELAKVKLKVCRELKLERVPKNSEILEFLPEGKTTGVLRLKPVRTISGVTILTVMPRPHPCPKNSPCIYCPGGLAAGTPQSYTGKEPAAMRAIQAGFDPRAQVESRIRQLRAIGHEVDKVELIIFGGTITAYPEDYMEWFVKECLNGISGGKTGSLEEAHVLAENAPIRVSVIVLETRPDCCMEHHVDFMLKLGATRVELGVQTVYDDVYRLINREHTVEDVALATRVAKDAGFAVVYHCMPNLPGSSFERDLKMFRMIFSDERFRPDAIKIYPTLVMPRTKLHEMWVRGDYLPYSFEKVVELVKEVKKMVPP
ncbi:MAG: tRNA uridine(34) 5-carboxymethylaminomethyl modification radical SAM/GNAT enzyme Elp3, partial [Candidatus Hadarchaeales archaeon]